MKVNILINIVLLLSLVYKLCINLLVIVAFAIVISLTIKGLLSTSITDWLISTSSSIMPDLLAYIALIDYNMPIVFVDLFCTRSTL